MNDVSVRIRSVAYLIKNRNLTPGYYTKFLNHLIRKDKGLIGSYSKLYINSQLHRERFRLWQTLILIYPRLNKVRSEINPLLKQKIYSFEQFYYQYLCENILLNQENHESMFDYCEENLVTENQPSIRFINEWLMLKIISDHKLDQVIGLSQTHTSRDDQTHFLTEKTNNVLLNRT